MSATSRAYYVSCFHCKNKPATIKCFNCKPAQRDETYEKLCYKCDGEIHSLETTTSHSKEFIPFLEMKSNKAKDNASLNFFANEKKPKYNAKNEIITRINNLNEKFSPPKPYNLTTTQTRSYESNIVNRSLNQFTRKPLTLNENSYSKNNIEQFSNQQKPVDKDNKLENEFVLEIKNLTEELEKQKKILNEKKKLNEEKYKQGELAIEDHQTKNSQLSEDFEQLSLDYENQISELKSSLHELRNQYEIKLKEFEKMLKASSDAIKNLQISIKESQKQNSSESNIENDPEVLALKKELNLVNDGISLCEKGLTENKQKFESSNGAYQAKMIEQDKVIEELSNINQLKHNEIQKLDELIKNFEELFGHYQEERDNLTQENEKINEELKKFNDILQRIDDREDREGDNQTDSQHEDEEGNENN